MRRRRKRFSYDFEEEAEVPLSPLIDCVFLLLIFFLVTTTLKRKEKQIPVTLPDATSALAQKASDDTLVVGLDVEGNWFAGKGTDGQGKLAYREIPDLAEHLKSLVQENGPATLARPLRIDVDRETPFKKTIDAIDICKLQGFETVSVKTLRGAQTNR